MGASFEIEIERLVEDAWEDHQTERLVDHYARVAIRFVERHGPTTFMALENELVDQGLRDVNGKYALLLSSGEVNLCLWAAMSRLFVRIMQRVAASGRVVYRPAPFALYTAVRSIIGLPMVSEVRDYEQLCWLPVTLWPAEIVEARP